ncbi:hypothetical protein SNEBB_004616 [Seison nebaliae]|nr:hypothetical protein SNEBB_004616 [Seison nebaliae]
MNKIIRFPRICKLSVRPYSIYSDAFQEPTLNVNELSSIDSNDVRKFSPIKPPSISEHPSLTYDKIVEKFIGVMMEEGKRGAAEIAMEETFFRIKLKQLKKWKEAKSDEERKLIELNPRKILKRAIENVSPIMRIVLIRKGGISYQVPEPINEKQATFRAIKMIIETAKDKDSNTRIYDTLSDELIDATNMKGKSIRKKNELHKLAEANRAFAHFRWS